MLCTNKQGSGAIQAAGGQSLKERLQLREQGRAHSVLLMHGKGCCDQPHCAPQPQGTW